MTDEEITKEEKEILKSFNSIVKSYNKGNGSAKALVIDGCFGILKDAIDDENALEWLNAVENKISIEQGE